MVFAQKRHRSRGREFFFPSSSVFESIERFCLSFSRDRLCVLAFSLVEEKKRSNEKKHPLSHPSYQHSPIITHSTKNNGLHFIRFGFTPAQTTRSLEKFSKKLRLRQGTVSYSVCCVLKRELREEIFFFFLSLSFGFGIQFCCVPLSLFQT